MNQYWVAEEVAGCDTEITATPKTGDINR